MKRKLFHVSKKIPLKSQINPSNYFSESNCKYPIYLVTEILKCFHSSACTGEQIFRLTDKHIPEQRKDIDNENWFLCYRPEPKIHISFG
jgi:hypothetical protein